MMNGDVQLTRNGGREPGEVSAGATSLKLTMFAGEIRRGVSVWPIGSTTRNDAFVPSEYTVRQSVGSTATYWPSSQCSFQDASLRIPSTSRVKLIVPIDPLSCRPA